MKVLHIIAGAETGGAETYFTDAVRALAARGVKQCAITRPHAMFESALNNAGVGREHLSFARWTKPWAQRRIRAAVEREKPDLIHAWMARAASFVPRGLGVRVLGWFGGPYDLKYYRNCDYYIGVTRGLKSYLDQETGQPDRTFCVHTFGTLPTGPPVTRAELGVPDGVPVILMLARLHWQKGVDVALRALVDVPSAHLLIAGDGPARAEYEALAQALNVADRAHFLGWRTDRATLLALADVVAMPSREDAFGTVMAEAWGAGVPLVAARAAGPSQYVEHGDNGLLGPIDDAGALAAQLSAALDDPDLRARLITGGRRTYGTLFSEDVAVGALLDAYRKIAAP